MNGQPSVVFPGSDTYPIAGLHITFVDSLHNAALLIRNISHPVRLASSYDQMCLPSLHVTVQLFSLVDLEFAWVLDRAGCTIV